jgi:hypothetical protein
MGVLRALFGHSRGRAAPGWAGLWRPTGEGVIEYADGEAPEVGDQYGNSYAVTYWNPVLGGCQITVRYCAVRYEAWGNGEWGVERTIEWSAAGSPGDEPRWQESETSLVSENALDSIADADDLAEQFAHEDDSDRGAELHGTWDGRPFDLETAGG